MKSLLVVAPHPELSEAVGSAVNSSEYRVIHRLNLDDAEPLLAYGLADACILDLELTGVQGIWLLEKLRRVAPKCPVIIFTGANQWEFEEEAILRGASHILTKPVKPRMLAALLSRLWSGPTTPPRLPAISESTSTEIAKLGEQQHHQANLPSTTANTLSVLRDFSGILTHSLNADAMLKQFLILLREILSINRAAIFLRQPFATFGEIAVVPEGQRLRAASAIGLPSTLLHHINLSFESGIGGQVFRLGRILRRSSAEARQDVETQKEFELLGAHVAVPILDRETVLGIAVFDGRITGDQLVNSELELIFHLLEQLGLAIKNIWLHDQLTNNHEMMAGILRELSSACVVVNRDLSILHANKMARKYFGGADHKGTGELTFPDLPQELGAKVFQVLKTGSAVTNFRYEPENSPGTLYNISVVPFQRPSAGLPASALLMAEDLSQSDQLQRLEIEAANLRLVKTMADRLTHEIGNAMVPLSTHQQLLADKWKDPEFRASLDVALAESVKRVNRLINQMRFLARDTINTQDAFPLGPLIEEAYQEARKYQPVKTAQLKYDTGGAPIVFTGDRAALKHALSEVMLNALQANPADPKIGVKLHAESAPNGREGLQIEVQDNGSGFTSESAQQAAAPFFTTRNVGLGLGLTVSRKIIETHHGTLEIVSPKTGQSGVVRINLPISQVE